MTVDFYFIFDINWVQLVLIVVKIVELSGLVVIIFDYHISYLRNKWIRPEGMCITITGDVFTKIFLICWEEFRLRDIIFKLVNEAFLIFLEVILNNLLESCLITWILCLNFLLLITLQRVLLCTFALVYKLIAFMKALYYLYLFYISLGCLF